MGRYLPIVSLPVLLACVLLASLLTSGGCKGPEAKLPAIAKRASSASSSGSQTFAAARAAATADLLAARKDGLKFGAAIDVASDLLEKDPQSTVFAGAVLDAIEQAGESVGTGGEFEMFWMKVGRLACSAADVAMVANRVPEARSLVLAGSLRWQHENYWRRYPDHDALAAAVLAASGERDLALQRLRSRDELESPAKEVYEQLLHGPKPPAAPAKP